MLYRFICVLILATSFALPAGQAAAHAIILSSNPESGAIVPTGKLPLTLRFNSRIDHERSVLTLLDHANHQLSLVISPDSATDTILSTTDDLPAGDYRLRWQVLSVDGHITRGDIPFTAQ